VINSGGTDKLTGLHDRWSFDELAEKAINDTAHDISLLLIDLDDFKSVNDQFGHPAGDAVLATVACRVQGAVRSDSIVGRYGGHGGDEFLILLPGTPNDHALHIAERVNEAIAHDFVRVPTDLNAHADLSVTASIGLATSTHPATLDGLIVEADSSLRDAKMNKSGRHEEADNNVGDLETRNQHILETLSFTRRIAGRWRAEILMALARGPCRYSALLRSIREESTGTHALQSSVLNRTLRKMELDGLVRRTVYDSIPRYVEYSITPAAHATLSSIAHGVASTSMTSFQKTRAQ
jgi:diguanylate cyclase (GGDEF)-like protein